MITAAIAHGAQVGMSRAAETANQATRGIQNCDLLRRTNCGSWAGVKVIEITQPGTKYHFYQYTGLRMPARSADRFVLLPSGWRHGRDCTFLLQDNDSIRIDIEVR
jgi:hypothetical protein